MPSPLEWRERALAAERESGIEAALALVDEALAEHPADPGLSNLAGNIAMRAGRPDRAEPAFARAAKLDPQFLEFTLNRAIALSALGRNREAIEILAAHEAKGADLPRYCSVRAACARALRQLDEAARWYDRALSLEPRHLRALHGRARVALERGEADARTRFERALALRNDDADLWLGRAQALDVEGNRNAAREIAEALVEQAPGWIEGLRFVAQLRLADGEEDYTAHYREAVRRQPRDPNIWQDWIGLLGGLDRHHQAAEIAAEARRRFPGEPFFALAEAIQSGAAGDDERAEEIFRTLELQTVDRWLNEARHRIRRREPDRAEQLITLALAEDDQNIAGWALMGMVWRITGDDRAHWLHGQQGLYRLLPLEGDGAILDAAAPLLDRLHDHSPLPLGQSLRGGTQTRGCLFDRTESELRDLADAIRATLETYRAGLPPADPAHPLLRHRDAPWQLAGSWSVRLLGGGDYHTAHIHPQGVISSALYVELPSPSPTGDGQAGWLEIGRPPPDLRLDLPPLASFEPRRGHLALFPSTLYHGTRPFPAQRRMTVAFDVTPGLPTCPITKALSP